MEGIPAVQNRRSAMNRAYCWQIPLDNYRPTGRLIGIYYFTHMPPDSSPKRQALRASGTFNPRAAQVRHKLFEQSDFFDPEDLLQLKYETLRTLEKDGYSIAQAAREFGLSRPTIYQAQQQLRQQGLEGLLPQKRGPQKPHKLTEEVVQFLRELTTSQPSVSSEELARRVRQRFQVRVHRRTIEKALKSKAKRGRQ